MSSKFEMSDLGKLTYYLGIEVNQHQEGITLKQERYANKILEEAGMDECNAVHIPMDSGIKMSKAQGEKQIDEKTYRRNIGCLRYLLHTRPDFSYCVGVLSSRMEKTSLIGYSDSGHNVDADDGRKFEANQLQRLRFRHRAESDWDGCRLDVRRRRWERAERLSNLWIVGIEKEAEEFRVW
ncbi:unnamed protein product [Microthlaspi erraticum]|uniref:Reverse transcriptase Ty1/copia-type domain-containing protein n=1 Tax=Microthlaspi erraticum TaxID=1685480 RepID=A0A6D2JQF2_9BRAS|nr:unnamed protein product [Microthlaspi erraticum]